MIQRRSPLIRRAALRQKSKQMVRDSVLDRLARHLYVVLRDNNQCQRCGAEAWSEELVPHLDEDYEHREHATKIDWSHVVTRGAKSCRWAWWNSKALCAGCHRWWSSHPLEAAEWFKSKWPDRYAAWQAWRRERRRPKIDRPAIKLWLEQETAKHADPS